MNESLYTPEVLGLVVARTFIIRSNDTDVVTLAISSYLRVKALGMLTFRIAYGKSKDSREICIHAVAQSCVEKKSVALRVFSASFFPEGKPLEEKDARNVSKRPLFCF